MKKHEKHIIIYSIHIYSIAQYSIAQYRTPMSIGAPHWIYTNDNSYCLQANLK